MNSGDNFKKLDRKYESKKILNVPWRILKRVVMSGKAEHSKLVIPLDEHDQFLI